MSDLNERKSKRNPNAASISEYYGAGWDARGRGGAYDADRPHAWVAGWLDCDANKACLDDVGPDDQGR